MKANLAYIDDTLDREIETRATTPNIPEQTRADIRGKAQKCIAGFHLHDEVAEKKMLDDLIADRRKQIDAFRADRTKVREALGALGVTPLAVVPLRAWQEICLTSALFLLSPDKEGRIAIPSKAFENYSAKEIAAVEKGNWPELVRRFFPDGRTASTRGSILATLVLPEPPPEVAAILIKVQSLKLEVAAVADAIRFKETAAELHKRSTESQGEPGKPFRGYKSYEEWREKCPVIYTEQGTAAAIIAQFGDFPVEKQVVDAVVAADDLITTKPQPTEQVSSSAFGDMHEMYLRYAQQQLGAAGQWVDGSHERERQAIMAQREQLVREAMYRQGHRSW